MPEFNNIQIPEWACFYNAQWDLAKDDIPIPMTVGDTIFVYQFHIPIPEKPDEKEIDGWDLPKKEQKFRRTEVPFYWSIKYIKQQAQEKYDGDESWYRKNPEKRQIDWAKKQWHYRTFGYWFMNNGVATYLPGCHWYYLNCWILDGGIRPEYRDLDRRKYLYYDYCWKDPDCLGILEPKKRREGATSRIMCFGHDKITQKPDAIFGNQSKTEKHARRNFRRITKANKHIPLYFRPMQSGTDDPKQELNFYAPSRKISAKTGLNEIETALNSTIDFRSTDANAYDTDKLYVYVHDEGGKVELCNVYEETWDVVRQCLVLGRRKVGFSFWPSTVGGMTSKTGNTGQAYKRLAMDSDIKTKGKNNRTTTGLYRVFTKAEDGLEGFIDEYGNSVIENPTEKTYGVDASGRRYEITQGSREYLENELEQIKQTGNRNKINNQRRMYPQSEAEAFYEENTWCLFDSNLIHFGLDEIERNPYSKLVCNLEWENGIPFSRVIMKKTEGGRFVFFRDPSKYSRMDYEIKMNNVQRISTAIPDGIQEMPPIFKPLNTDKFAIAIDPFSSKQVTHGNGSNAGMFGYWKHDIHIDHPGTPREQMITDNFIFEYICRPASTLILAQDVIKACFFLGCEVLVETNKTTLLDQFDVWGMQAFLMYQQIFNRASQSALRMAESPGQPSTSLSKEAIVDALEIYLTDNYMRCPSQKLLLDMLKFDIAKTEDYDACMGAGYTLIAAKKPNRGRPIIVNQDVNLYRTYKKSGANSFRQPQYSSEIDNWTPISKQ